MIPKLLGLAAAGAGTLLATGIAIGRWSQTVLPPATPPALFPPTATATAANHPAALAAFEASLTAPGIGDTRDRRKNQGKAIDALDADAFPAAWKATGRLSAKPFRIQTRLALLNRWSALDPAAAAEAATALPENEARTHALRTVATAWLQSDFRTAAAWCARQPSLTLALRTSGEQNLEVKWGAPRARAGCPSPGGIRGNAARYTGCRRASISR